MNLGKLGLFATGAIASVALVIACSSSSSSSSGGTGDGGSSGSSGSSGGGGTCFAPGTYHETFTSDANNPETCAKPEDQDITFEASDGGSADAGPDCTLTTSSDGCTQTIHCSTTTSGITVVVDGTIKDDGSGNLTGSQELKEQGLPGGDTDCKFTLAATKK